MYFQVKPKAIKKLILLRKGTQVLTLYGYHYQQTKHLQLLIPVLCDISSRSTRLEDKGEHQGGPARLFSFLPPSPRTLCISHVTIRFLPRGQFTSSLASRPIAINQTHYQGCPPPSYFVSSQSPATCVTQPCHFSSPTSPSQSFCIPSQSLFSFFSPPSPQRLALSGFDAMGP